MAGQIKADKWKKVDYLKAVAEYYSEEMQATENLKDKDMLNLILQTTSASDGVVVDDKSTPKSGFLTGAF